MIRQVANASNRSLVETIQHAMEDASEEIEWLIIAHNDARLVRSLASSVSNVSVFILESPQGTWDFGEGELFEAIEWATEQPSIKHLAIVGHSDSNPQRDLPAMPVVTDSMQTRAGQSDGYARPQQGVSRTTKQRHDSQAKFAEQLEQLSSIRRVSQKSANGELAVYGLFFIAESASFLAYDPDDKGFLPLIP